MKNCIFCQIIKGEKPAKKILEDEFIFAFEDINPQAPLHFLVVPKKHLSSLNTSNEEDILLLGHMLYKTKEIAISKGLGNGYRIVINTGAMAGQSIFHLHFHLLGGRAMGWPPG